MTTQLNDGSLVHNRLKVLVVAAAVHPNKGSEPGLGWGWVRALSCDNDLWVITGEREGNREAIEARFRKTPDLAERLKFFYLSRPDGPSLERIWPPLYYRLYRQWHQQAFRLARRLEAEVGFDLVHQLNMQGYREPGYLWKLDKPFVWGPVGGTANVPLRFASVLGPKEFLYHLAKVTINNLQLRYHRRVGQALGRADGFATSTSETRAAFLHVRSRDSTVIQETGPDPELLASRRPSRLQGDGPLRLVWNGIHVSRKALPILLRAIARLHSVSWHLDIIGEGPMTRHWKRLAERLGVSAGCTWHGWLPKREAVAVVAGADLFTFPSLHEGNPTVVWEALACGVPVICLDHCGMTDVVTPNCGIKIPVTNVDEVVGQLAKAITDLAQDPSRRRCLAVGALSRAAEFSWEVRAQKMLDVYRHALLCWQTRKVQGNLRQP